MRSSTLAHIDTGFQDPRLTHGKKTGLILQQSYLAAHTGLAKFDFLFEDLPDKGDILKALVANMDGVISDGIRVVNLPVGITTLSPLFSKVIEQLTNIDVLLITPSGNKGPNTVLSPGIHPETLCVGAADKSGQVASFSGRQYDKEGNCIKPDVLAEGVDVEISLENGEVHRASGTSLACATVAGLAAALFDANPAASADDVKLAIYESCTPAEGSRYGLINPEKAMENIRTKAPYNRKPKLVEPPAFMNETYIDYRLKSQCRRASRNNEKVEALVTAGDTKALMQRLVSENTREAEYTMFKNFDMAHVQATPAFYETLFEQPDLQVASAVDINYFDL